MDNPSKKTSGLAISSLVLGICSLIFGWIPFIGWVIIIVTIILSIASIYNIKKNKDLSGMGMAIAGLILGIISLLMITLIVVGIFSTFNKISDEFAKPKQVAEKIIYSQDQDIPVDYFIYRVNRVESFQEMGLTGSKKKTEEIFIKVYLEIKNNANETQQILSNRVKIIDNQGRIFDPLSGASNFIADSFEWGVQIQPTLKASGATVFEIPKESQDLKLEIKGDWLSNTKVLVNLSNIDDIGIDTTLEKKQGQLSKQTSASNVSSQSSDNTKATTFTINGKQVTSCDEPLKCLSSCSGINAGQLNCPTNTVCCWLV
jgi:hypothetical protein